jgi:cytochrome c peroxidase
MQSADYSIALDPSPPVTPPPARPRGLLTVPVWGAVTALLLGAALGRLSRGGEVAAPEESSTAPAARPSSRPTSRPTTRPAPRPELSPAEYDALAKELRAAYLRKPAEWPPATIDPGVEYVELGLLRPPEHPKENPFSEAKAELGKLLFFDPRLSGSGQIACASCHEPQLGWSDGRAVSFGHARSPLRRNAPALTNVAMRKSMFWDGRAASLEAQASEPLAASDEMNADPAEVVRRLSAQPGYRQKFAEAFGDDAVRIDRVAAALATYERTIVSRPSPFDKFLKGDADALPDPAVRGLHLFRTQGRCANCHMGPTLTDEKFHDVGLSYYGRELEDLGRYHVTKDPKDVGKFKTPSLRNLPRTAPYMHNGLFDLTGVLNMYNAGMPTLRRKPAQADDPLFPTKSPLLQPLRLNKQDLADLRAFLESLAELRLRVRPPPLPGEAPARQPAGDKPPAPEPAGDPAAGSAEQDGE